MNVEKALLSRKSTRAFLDKEVPVEIINNILEQAKTAPSGVNTQPWQVAVITGESKKILKRRWRILLGLATRALWTISTTLKSGKKNTNKEGKIAVYSCTRHLRYKEKTSRDS